MEMSGQLHAPAALDTVVKRRIPSVIIIIIIIIIIITTTTIIIGTETMR
jgi:hypothetical protein